MEQLLNRFFTRFKLNKKNNIALRYYFIHRKSRFYTSANLFLFWIKKSLAELQYVFVVNYALFNHKDNWNVISCRYSAKYWCNERSFGLYLPWQFVNSMNGKSIFWLASVPVEFDLKIVSIKNSIIQLENTFEHTCYGNV